MFCSKCGYKMSDGARFCEQCGWEIGTSVSDPTNEQSWLSRLEAYLPKFGLAVAWRAVLLIAGFMLVSLVIHYFEIYSANAEYNMYFYSTYEGGAAASQLFIGIPYLFLLAVLLVFTGLISTKVDTEYIAFACIWYAPHFMEQIRDSTNITDGIAEMGLYRALVYSSAADKTDTICPIVLVLLIIVFALKIADEVAGEKAKKRIVAGTYAAKKAKSANIAYHEAPEASAEGNSEQRFAKKVGRLADRLSTINSEANESTQNTWKCGQCGFVNDRTQDCCKSCGKYK